jgi:hypothetical protein
MLALTEQTLLALQMGESTFIEGHGKSTRNLQAEVSRIKQILKAKQPGLEFKFRYQNGGIYVVRTAKIVDKRRYSLIYENGSRRQVIFDRLPYPLAVQKEKDYKRNPNFKTGKIYIEQCK